MSIATPLKGAAPHAHDRSSVDKIMLYVCLALVPTTAYGIYLLGWPALLLWLITCTSAVATEVLCLQGLNQPTTRIKDLSALLTGWLLALSLPPWAPWWIAVGGSVFAIGIGKQLYGGIGQNVFNPAMLARVALLISFPVQMSTWPHIAAFGSELAPGFTDSVGIIFGFHSLPDASTGATILGEAKANYTTTTPIADMLASKFSFTHAVLGNTNGSLGETSDLLIYLGGFWLLYLRIISWHIPVAVLASTAAFAAIANGLNPVRFANPWFHLSSGGLALGAFFIATDYVTSPATPRGKLIFGSGVGFMVFAIRSWSGFPESVAFAVLFMNALTPLIDRYTKPRAYGRTSSGKPVKNTPPIRKVN